MIALLHFVIPHTHLVEEEGKLESYATGLRPPS
jgi:hypothetical protein